MVPMSVCLLAIDYSSVFWNNRQISSTKQETSENQRAVLIFTLCVLSSWHSAWHIADAQKHICRMKCLERVLQMCEHYDNVPT